VDELHTSDEGASNVHPRVHDLVTIRVIYYAFSTTRSRLFLRPKWSPQKFLKKYFSTPITYRYTTEMHYFSRWFHCIGIVFEICQQYILWKGFNVILFFPIHKCLINTLICLSRNFFGSILLVGILSISIISGGVRISSSLALNILQLNWVHLVKKQIILL
jgi:hypothetical protein